MKFLFDLGGVFFDWDPKHFYKDIFSSNDDMEYFLTNICNNEWNLQQDAGKKIEDAEFELIQQFPKYKKEIVMYYKNHRKMIKNIFQSSIDALKELKSRNYKCYVLSNWSSETFIGMCDEYKFLNDFEKFLTEQLGENWSYNFDGEDDGLSISMQVWGDKFVEEQE